MRILITSTMAFFVLTFATHGITDDSILIEQGIALKAKAEQGDADAMMALAAILLKHAPEPKRPYTICDGKRVNPLIKRDTSSGNCDTVVDEENEKQLELWKPVGNRYMASQWINKAAAAGNRQAIAMKCSIKDDKLAPPALQEEAEYWCGKL